MSYDWRQAWAAPHRHRQTPAPSLTTQQLPFNIPGSSYSGNISNYEQYYYREQQHQYSSRFGCSYNTQPSFAANTLPAGRPHVSRQESHTPSSNSYDWEHWSRNYRGGLYPQPYGGYGGYGHPDSTSYAPWAASRSSNQYPGWGASYQADVRHSWYGQHSRPSWPAYSHQHLSYDPYHHHSGVETISESSSSHDLDGSEDLIEDGDEGDEHDVSETARFTHEQPYFRVISSPIPTATLTSSPSSDLDAHEPPPSTRWTPGLRLDQDRHDTHKSAPSPQAQPDARSESSGQTSYVLECLHPVRREIRRAKSWGLPFQFNGLTRCAICKMWVLDLDAHKCPFKGKFVKRPFSQTV
jgi:hypothetical protein